MSRFDLELQFVEVYKTEVVNLYFIVNLSTRYKNYEGAISYST